jgi:hypothetical protein
MPNKDFSDEIVIRFTLKRGDGEFPSREDLTDEEIADPQKICNFHLDLDYSKFDEDVPLLPLKEITIIYDGITEYRPDDQRNEFGTHGFYWSELLDEFIGYPTPVIKFKFSQLVHKDSFRSLIELSSVNICSKRQKESESEGYFFEDYSGWADILEGSKLTKYLKFLKSAKLYSGRKFNFTSDQYIFPLTRD